MVTESMNLGAEKFDVQSMKLCGWQKRLALRASILYVSRMLEYMSLIVNGMSWVQNGNPLSLTEHIFNVSFSKL
jgi:hypothetical protein